MNSFLKHPLSPLESKIWKRLQVDFTNEIACIHRSLYVLQRALNSLTEEIFVTNADISDIIKDIDKLGESRTINGTDLFKSVLKEPKRVPVGVWLLLCGEALERLIAGRLLLLTGHQSRALSTIRDAYECLQFADVCRSSDKESDRWIIGRKVKVPNNFNYTYPLSAGIIDHELFNTWGTHAYFRSVLLSLLPLAPFHPKLSEAEWLPPFYKTYTLASLGFMLNAIELMFVYLLSIYPSLKETAPEIPLVCLKVLSTRENIAATLEKEKNK